MVLWLSIYLVAMRARVSGVKYKKQSEETSLSLISTEISFKTSGKTSRTRWCSTSYHIGDAVTTKREIHLCFVDLKILFHRMKDEPIAEWICLSISLRNDKGLNLSILPDEVHFFAGVVKTQWACGTYCCVYMPDGLFAEGKARDTLSAFLSRQVS